MKNPLMKSADALQYWIADVFTDQPLAGNPLAVFPNAPALTTERMQAIARELNLSETVFVYPPENPAHAAAIRIFTPATELPFAGHPTVGTALVLAALQRLENATREGDVLHSTLEEGVGPIPIRVVLREGHPVFAQFTTARLPLLQPAASREALAAMLSLPTEEVGAHWEDVEFAPAIASCGVAFVCVPLRSLDALRRAQLNTSAIPAALRDSHRQFYLYVPTGEESVRTRMYGAELGIVEDPATGGAAAALAGVLAHADPRSTGKLRWHLTQGVEMGRPSLIEVEADKVDEQITAVRIGGSAVIVGQGNLMNVVLASA